ncbi:MAG: hypothetical protein IKR04_04135 [Clostridia bacterium]|nr:hypothetical protein [Clostridia bacterium]
MDESNLMSKQDMWNVATDTIVKYLEKENYTIEGVNSSCNTYPNIVASKDGTLYGIIIDVDEVRKQPKYSTRRTFDMLRFARKFNAVPLYASVGLGAANPERFDKELLIKHDPEGYYANFVGFEDINLDIEKNLTKEEMFEFIPQILGTCYETKDFSILEKYLAEDCKWCSFFSGNKYNSKQEIMKYYKEKSESIKNTEISYFLIKYIGDWFEFKVASLQLPNGSIDKNTIVRLPQPGDSIGIVVEQIKEDGEKVGMAVALKYNAQGFLNDIYIGDPYAMNFEDYYKLDD